MWASACEFLCHATLGRCVVTRKARIPSQQCRWLRGPLFNWLVVSFLNATGSNDCCCTQNLEVSFTRQQYQNPGLSGSPSVFFTDPHALGPHVLSGPRQWLSFLWKARSHGVPPGAPPGKGTLPPCPAETEETMGHVPFVITHRSERSSCLSAEHAAGRIN